MTIKRTVNGEECSITLTDHELFLAFEEQQHIFDRYDCSDLVEGLTNDEVMDCYGTTREQFSQLLDDIAYEMRRNIDKYDMSWEYARDEAIHTVVRRSKG